MGFLAFRSFHMGIRWSASLSWGSHIISNQFWAYMFVCVRVCGIGQKFTNSTNKTNFWYVVSNKFTVNYIRKVPKSDEGRFMRKLSISISWKWNSSIEHLQAVQLNDWFFDSRIISKNFLDTMKFEEKHLISAIEYDYFFIFVELPIWIVIKYNCSS